MGAQICSSLNPFADCLDTNCNEADQLLVQGGLQYKSMKDCFCGDEISNFACDSFFTQGDTNYRPTDEALCPYRCYTAIVKADELCTIGDSITAPDGEIFVFDPFEFNLDPGFEEQGCSFPTPPAVKAIVEGSFTLDLVVPTEMHAVHALADILAISIEQAAGAGVAVITKIGSHDLDSHEGHNHRKLKEVQNAFAAMSVRKLAATAIEYELIVTTTCTGACTASDTAAATTALTTAVTAFETAATTSLFVTMMAEAAQVVAFETGVDLTSSVPTTPATGLTSTAPVTETVEAYVPAAPAPPTAEDNLGGSASSLKIGMSAVLAVAVAFIAVQ